MYVCMPDTTAVHGMHVYNTCVHMYIHVDVCIVTDVSRISAKFFL